MIRLIKNNDILLSQHAKKKMSMIKISKVKGAFPTKSLILLEFQYFMIKRKYFKKSAIINISRT